MFLQIREGKEIPAELKEESCRVSRLQVLRALFVAAGEALAFPALLNEYLLVSVGIHWPA